MDGNAGEATKLETWAKNIFAVTLFVKDLDVTKEFYKRVFSLPIDYEDADSAVFKFGATMINLLKISAADELVEPAKAATSTDESHFVFTIVVDDVDAMCAELRQRGVTLLNGPMDRPWGIRTASFKDPAGYIWEIAK
ncbi:MAG: VOC family protein [Chloroflexi bacterium]|nr:VOC family protein [Chloroflexota bacterium]